MIQIAFSPCPNDTFIFGAWAKGIVFPETKVEASLLDIESLNVALRRGQFPLQKASALTAFQCLDAYDILPVGGALGYGVGPVIVAKKKCDLKDLSGKKIAFPGEGTTAHFLFQLYGPIDFDPVFVSYEKVIPMIQKGVVDAGVLIHEGRFILEREGLKLIADLGNLWEEQENLPLPLGVVAARKDLKDKELYVSAIQASLSYARQHLKELYPYILENSIEKEPNVVDQHISLYVNKETTGWSETGERALHRFFERGVEIGLYNSEQTPLRFCNYS